MARRKRIDPPSTSADGTRRLDVVLNKDPARFYVFVNPNDEGSLAHYRDLGGEPVPRSADGPKLIGAGIGEGDYITRYGSVLWSYPREHRIGEERAWAAKADGFDSKVLKDGNIDDPLRGRHSWGRNGVDHSQTEWRAPRGAAAEETA